MASDKFDDYLQPYTDSELYIFAGDIGLKREWVQLKPAFYHFDVNPRYRALAVANGAIELSNADMVKLIVWPARKFWQEHTLFGGTK